MGVSSEVSGGSSLAIVCIDGEGGTVCFSILLLIEVAGIVGFVMFSRVYIFYKNSSIKLPKRQKNKCKYACGLMTETDRHTHASNDSYKHPPR